MNKDKTLTLNFAGQAQCTYPIHISTTMISDNYLWQGLIKGKQVCVVTNAIVANYYLKPLLKQLENKEVIIVELEDGEHHKTLETVANIWDQLIQARFNRDATIVALGGGIVGDIAGFAAASYQRGIDFIQVPTTLLAQVDSSVGGKTGVNHSLGKNMIGAFYQPQAVLIDVSTLSTLPEREFSAGLAEVIKYGLINDKLFFTWLEQYIEAINSKQDDVLIEMIAQCCQHKADIVVADEREAGQRALLNLGHTFGHAIETLTNYQCFKHGEAVAIGIRMAAELSQILGYLTPDEVMRIRRLLGLAQLPDSLGYELDASEILNLMYLDKKVAKGQLRLVLMHEFGQSKIQQSVDNTSILSAIQRSYNN